MKLKYIKGSKFFQRHWVVNLVKEEAKKSGVFGPVTFIDEEIEMLRERSKKKFRNAIYSQRLWHFVQPFLDDCMVRFGLVRVDLNRDGFYFSYFSPREEDKGFFGRNITKSRIERLEISPYQHEIYSLIKQIFKQYYDGKSV